MCMTSSVGICKSLFMPGPLAFDWFEALIVLDSCCQICSKLVVIHVACQCACNEGRKPKCIDAPMPSRYAVTRAFTVVLVVVVVVVVVVAVSSSSSSSRRRGGGSSRGGGGGGGGGVVVVVVVVISS